MLLHAIAATQHYAEPQQGTAKESEAGGLGDRRRERRVGKGDGWWRCEIGGVSLEGKHMHNLVGSGSQGCVESYI